MNEELKDVLDAQGKRVRDAVFRAETAKSALETFDANSRNTIKASGIPPGWAKAPTDDDTKTLVIAAAGRAPLVAERIATMADAEGIEAEPQADFLRQAGCQIGQGYLYSRPMPADAIARYWTGAMP